ncbi:MAG: glycosyltransferase [Alphaproteobacteria bacterium]|nr:glycosyltransferase [Alphaproteobacteria bacterium]
MPIRIAAVVPAYNRADELGECLDSILAQRLPPAEIFVCDDGSSDGTDGVLASYGDRVRWRTVANGGPAAARAHAIAATSSPWIAPCDSDDLWETDHLERLAEAVARWPGTDLAFANFRFFGPGAAGGADKFSTAPPGWWERFDGGRDGDFRYLGEAPYAAFLDFQPVFTTGMLYTRALYEAVGGTSPLVARLPAEDAHLTRRMLSRATVACDWKVTSLVRRHAGNFSGEDLLNTEGRLLILELLARDPLIRNRFGAATLDEADRTAEGLFHSYFYIRRFDWAAALVGGRRTLRSGWRGVFARLLAGLGLGAAFSRYRGRHLDLGTLRARLGIATAD